LTRLRYFLIGALLVGGAAFWALTRPNQIDPDLFAGLDPSVDHGQQVFTAAGCASCHMAPGAEGEAKLVLSGGQRFETPFGTFLAPNISPDPVAGIGGWSVTALADAVMRGVSPEGQHYYPAFPWDSYRGMTPQDMVDLHAYMATLPLSPVASQSHELPLPLQVRRGIGLWKLAFGRSGWVVPDEGLTDAEMRGRYLAEVLGHCGECHTLRNTLTGAPDRARWLGGGPDASGKGRVPNITPGGLDWSEAEIVEYLTSGFTPDFDSAGGHMALVVGNFSQLPEEDRAAVAAYLMKVPAVR